MSLAESFQRVTSGRTMARPGPLFLFALLSVAFALTVTLAFAASIREWTPMAFLAVPLVLASSVWISCGAATALVGLVLPVKIPNHKASDDALATTPTAILVTLCGEDAGPVARYLIDLRRALDHTGQAAITQIFVLSDTTGAQAIAAEKSALHAATQSGLISYRRRDVNTGRKPGNIAQWLRDHGARYPFMLVLDADSRMSARRIYRMIRELELRPQTGLLQAAISIVPGTTRFDRHQRLSARLLSPNFMRGFAAWTGQTGNYWGHNAIMRVAAFRSAASLPVLTGQAPMGGAILSHDFVEAAWMRRAGWAIELLPELAGSAEQAPPTLHTFHRRDRRWCQGNLQHLRLLFEPGLRPLSRFHFFAGAFSYLAAPVWLGLVILIASGALAAGALPFALVACLLLVPKLCGLTGHLVRAGTVRRSRSILRGFVSETMISACLAPIVMVWQTAAIASVLGGQDCGWKSGRVPRFTWPSGVIEALAGLAVIALSSTLGTTASLLWLAPVILPLLAAPVFVRYLDAPA